MSAELARMGVMGVGHGDFRIVESEPRNEDSRSRLALTRASGPSSLLELTRDSSLHGFESNRKQAAPRIPGLLLTTSHSPRPAGGNTSFGFNLNFSISTADLPSSVLFINILTDSDSANMSDKTVNSVPYPFTLPDPLPKGQKFDPAVLANCRGARPSIQASRMRALWNEGYKAKDKALTFVLSYDGLSSRLIEEVRELLSDPYPCRQQG